MMKTIKELIGENSYPGRGIIIGKAPDGRAAAEYPSKVPHSGHRIPPEAESISTFIFRLQCGQNFSMANSRI